MKKIRTSIALGIATGLLAANGCSSSESKPSPDLKLDLPPTTANPWHALESLKMIEAKDGDDEPENAGPAVAVYDPDTLQVIGNIVANQVFGIDCKYNVTPEIIEVMTVSNVVGDSLVLEAIRQQVDAMQLPTCEGADITKLSNFFAQP